MEFRLPRECPECGTSISVREDGTLYPHNRYVRGGGPGPDQDHTMVPCEGGGVTRVSSTPWFGIIKVY